MEDKLAKARAEIEKAYNEAQNRVKLVKDEYWEGKVDAYRNVLCIFDSLQEEPVSKDKFTFTSLPRLLDRIKPTDRVKWYSNRLADTLEKEGYITDATIVRESIKIMNGEKVPMATMDEEPVNEDLGEYINELSKQFPEVSFAKLSRITVRVAKWQKQQILKAMDLGEPPYLISVEQAYYNVKKMLKED